MWVKAFLRPRDKENHMACNAKCASLQNLSQQKWVVTDRRVLDRR
jgi:hypothetical protein